MFILQTMNSQWFLQFYPTPHSTHSAFSFPYFTPLQQWETSLPLSLIYIFILSISLYVSVFHLCGCLLTWANAVPTLPYSPHWPFPKVILFVTASLSFPWLSMASLLLNPLNTFWVPSWPLLRIEQFAASSLKHCLFLLWFHLFSRSFVGSSSFSWFLTTECSILSLDYFIFSSCFKYSLYTNGIQIQFRLFKPRLSQTLILVGHFSWMSHRHSQTWSI